MELGVSFVQAASQSSESRVLEKGFEADVGGLKEFILSAGVDGINEKDLLAIVFQNQNHGKGWRNDDEMRVALDKSIGELQQSKPGPSRPWG